MPSYSEIFEQNTMRQTHLACPPGPHREALADALIDALNRQFPIEKNRAYRLRQADTESAICVMLPTWQLRRLNHAELEANMRRVLRGKR